MGLTATGITIKSLDEILTDIESDQLANIDPNLNLQPDGVLGQLNGIYAAALAEVWELLEEIYQSAYPDTASGQSLSYVAALTGAIRREATYAELDVVFYGTPLAVIPAGIRAYPDGDPESIFESTEDVTINAIGFETATMTAITVGSYPSATPSEILILLGSDPNLLYIQVGATDPLAEGLDEETDSQLRQRREQTLALPGASTVEAIRADMLQVTGVDSCTVFENPTSVVDVNGVPPYAIEVLVYSSGAPSYDAQDVVDQIWLSKPAGTQTYGGLSGTATDSLGVNHTIYYSEPTTVNLYVAVTLTTTTDGTYITDANVKQAIVDWGDKTLVVGQSVYASDIINVVADLTGVESVNVAATFVEAGDATPDAVVWNATARQLGILATSRITVTSS